MRKETRVAALVLALAACLDAASRAAQGGQGSGRATMQEERVTMRAEGTFEVRLTPAGSDEVPEGTPLGRMTIAKQFHGALEAESRGEMLTAVTPVKGSAGYVAMERVAGTLDGRRGTFVLQHSGTMAAGAQRLVIEVVPGSGTGQLTGLSGAMSITIADGKHSYAFDYSLGARP